MSALLQPLRSSPTLARVVPFVLFVGLTSLQGRFGEASRYWIYLLKTVLGAWMVWALRPVIPEQRWRFSRDAVAVGVLVFALWVGLEGQYPSLDALLKKIGLGGKSVATPPLTWNPFHEFANAPALGWFFVVARILGSSLVVPVLEEVFFRSFLYRYLIAPKFQEIPHRQWGTVAFLVTAVIFGFEHQEWLPGILCGFLYQLLVIRKDRLGDAITAHAITNFLLGCYVVWKNAWNFW